MLDITKPVWTRDGKPARIVCTDLKRDDGRTLIVNVDFGTWEDCRLYYPNGRNRAEDDPSYNGEDLTNEAPAPKQEAKPAITPQDLTILETKTVDVIERTLKHILARLQQIEIKLEVLHDNVSDVLGAIHQKRRNPRK